MPNAADLPATLQEARKAGSKFYFTGRGPPGLASVPLKTIGPPEWHEGETLGAAAWATSESYQAGGAYAVHQSKATLAVAFAF